MGRKRIYANETERKRAYDVRNKRSCARLSEWKQSNPHHISRKKTRAFVSIDSEGITRGKEHITVLWGSSTGDYIENYQTGLSSREIFDFILSQSRKDRILVGYSIGYDVNMSLKDVPPESLNRIAKGESATFKLGGTLYRVVWFPGKSFTVSLIDPKTYKAIQSAIIYDVFGFFQKAFIKTAREFNVITPEEDIIIERMKTSRSTFDEKGREAIRKYNFLECDILNRIMESLRESMTIADCVPERWNGAGAIASVLLKRNGIKEKNYSDPKMIPYFLGAYFGGRIQSVKMGIFPDIYTHDIVSAYPSVMVNLPSSIGEWKELKGFSNYPWSIYVVSWDIPERARKLAPFPLREKINGTLRISYPWKGRGVYWFPEVDQAIKHYRKYIRIEKSFVFNPEETGIFAWIEELFNARKRFKNSSNPKEQSAQLPIKLGINSLYGKTAQGIGWKDSPPPFQNFFWSGYITSSTRARMYELAMKSPGSIIAFATDGVFSTEKLTETDNILGGWEVDYSARLFLIKPGIYAFGNNFEEGTKTRGHFSASVNWEELYSIWKTKGVWGKYEYSCIKFRGLKTELLRNPPLANWRKWIEENRVINFYPSNSIVIDAHTLKDNYSLEPYLTDSASIPYQPKIDWFEGDDGLDYLSDLDQIDCL